MPRLTIIGIYLLMASAAPALRNNEPETWPSPNGKYAIKETFYGEGKLVRGIFVHTVTDRTAVIYPGGARSLSAVWSPDSHYVALNADRTKYRGETKLFRIEHGKISEIALPPKMDAKNYLSAEAQEHLGSLSFEGMGARRWLSNTQIEIVSETLANFLGEARGEAVSQHFIVEISRGEAKIIKTYAEK
jgi:hypothetical protein